MKKTLYFLLATGLFCVTNVLADNQPPAGTELRPTQKAMQARAGWVKDMNANLAAMKYEDVAKDATALAVQTDTIGKTLPNPLAKELTLKLSSLATATADAAKKKDAEATKIKLAEIKSTCGECHAKIRDKDKK